MLKSLHLQNVGPAPEMRLDLAPRLNLLTGDNGLGKSFILDVAWWALAGSWASHAAAPSVNRKEASITFEVRGMPRPFVGEYGAHDQRWSVPHMVSMDTSGDEECREPGLVVYARVDGGFSLWDPMRNERPTYRGYSERDSDRLTAYQFTPGTLWDGLEDRDRGRVVCNGLLRDWVSWQERRAPEFRVLRRVLEKLSPPNRSETLRPGRPTRMAIDDARRIPTLEMPYGEVPLPHASAAVARIVSLAYLLVWAWSEHLQAAEILGRPPADRIVFLIDEIEAHLHPRWQRTILPAVLAAARALQESEVTVQVLAVTHAPLVVASAEPTFDPELDALFTFDLEGERAVVRRAEWRRHGDVSSWLTSDIFDLGEARSLPAEAVLARAKDLMRREEPSLDEVRELHRAMAGVLPDTDPVWVRWLAALERKGIEI